MAQTEEKKILLKGQEQNKKFLAFVKRLLWQFRKYLEKKRKKNTKIFDALTKLAEVIWFFVSTFFTNLTQNTILLVLVMLIAFGGMYLFQWALLKNENDRIQEQDRSYYLEKESAIQKKKLEVVQFSHSVAHTIRDQMAKISHQEMRLTRQALADFLKESLNTLEKNLSSEYGVAISASVKLCTSKKRLKTFARGKNSIESRGGLAKVKQRDLRDIHIEKNYAYKAIIERQLQYFADGDLENLSMKEKDDDKFYCEYGLNWSKYFVATIIIPIRCPNFVGEGGTTEYEVKGMICIDSKEKMLQWTNSTESIAYNMTAFLADSVYGYIEAYSEQQKTDKRGTDKSDKTK